VSKFGKKIFENLNKNKSFGLSVLLEEEEDIFDKMDDEEESSEEKSSDSDKEEDSSSDEESKDSDSEGESDEGEGDEGGEGEEETKETSPEELSNLNAEKAEELAQQFAAMKATIDDTTKNDGLQSIESFIISATTSDAPEGSIDDGVFESKNLYNKKSINRFFLNEEVDIEQLEDDIDAMDRVINKGTELVDKFKKGRDLDIQSYVNAAINAYRNFDNLFAKEKIVKQATINVIVLNSGAKAEQNIKEFEELFHEELHKNFNVEYEEFALITKKNDTAAGAKSQG
jgi:hypothetical protein